MWRARKGAFAYSIVLGFSCSPRLICQMCSKTTASNQLIYQKKFPVVVVIFHSRATLIATTWRECKSGRLHSKFSMEVVLIDIPAFAECDGGAGKGSSFVVYVVRVAYQVRPSLLPPPSDVRARCCDAPALRTALTPSLSAPRYSPSLGRYSVVTRTSVR